MPSEAAAPNVTALPGAAGELVAGPGRRLRRVRAAGEATNFPSARAVQKS